MNADLNKAIEEAVPGLKIDGEVTPSDAVAVGAKVLEITAAVTGSITPNGKIDASDVSSVVKSISVLAPDSFKKAVLDELEEYVRDTKSKIDDAIALPVIAILRRLLGVK